MQDWLQILIKEKKASIVEEFSIITSNIIIRIG